MMTGGLKYEAVPGWEQLPRNRSTDDWRFAPCL